MEKKELAEQLNSAVEMCSEILEISEKTASVAKKALRIIGNLRTLYSIPDDTKEQPVAPAPAPEPEQKVDKSPAEDKPAEDMPSKEDVRKLLVEVSNSGHRDEVKALLVKYGADNLTKLDPSHYAAIMKDAEELKNAG